MHHSRSFLVGFALVQLGCFAPEQPPITGRTEKFELAAKHIDQTFHLFVRLPPGYEQEDTRTFPLVVQLDANLPTLEEFKVAAGFASRLEGEGALVPCIVVGIGYPTGNEASLRRFRDLGLPLDPAARALWGAFPDGAGAAFYDFLRDELLPELGTRYRVAPAPQRLLSGHSLGGFFVLYALTRHDEAPLFASYLAASPAIHWNGGQMLKLWNGYAGPTRPASLFSAAGDLEGPEMMAYFDEFNARVRATAVPQLSFETRTFNTDHPGTVAPSLAEGLTELARLGFGSQP
jgi:hypothetical protein